MPRMHFHDPRVVKNEEMDRLFWIAYTDTLILHRDTSIADSLFSSVTILKLHEFQNPFTIYIICKRHCLLPYISI